MNTNHTSILQSRLHYWLHGWRQHFQQAAQAMPPNALALFVVTFITLTSGVLNLAVALPYHGPGHPSFAPVWFPLEVRPVQRSLALFVGMALMVSALNIWKRKQRAFQFVLMLSGLSALLALWHGQPGKSLWISLLLITLLVVLRKRFTVKSRRPDWRAGVARFSLVLLIALGYGVAGFWLLDKKQFGINFNWWDSIKQTLLCLSLVGDPALIPQTRYAEWFLESLSLLTIVVVIYGLVALFRPILYRFRTLPQERKLAQQILFRHGRSALDNFKLWPDKSYFFNASRDCFIAYRVAANVAVVLADPVGPASKIEDTLRQFQQFCDEQGWSIALHQTQPIWLGIYRGLGFRKLKLGDDAIVDLTQFSLNSKRMKRFRQRVGQLEKHGVRFRASAAPVEDALLAQLQFVSDEWLQLPNRRERSFTVGSFVADYLRSTTIFTAEDEQGKILAFVNLLVSYYPGEVTIDLMRHRLQAPNGIMDYLFVKLFAWSREQGYTRFNLGMAPMIGFQEREEASAAERIVHAFFQRANDQFSRRNNLT